MISCITSTWLHLNSHPQPSYSPYAQGNTAQGGTKPATLDSGAVVQVPMFIEVGEKIIVSTDEVRYLNRAQPSNFGGKS